MSTVLPIKFTEMFKLPSAGIPPEIIKQANVCFESDKYITIKEISPDGNSNFYIVDILQNFKVQKKPLKADLAIMHPESNIISIKNDSQSGSSIQIADIAKKDQKTYELPEKIIYWHWLNKDILGLVGEKSIFHLNKNTNNYQKITERCPELLNAQILGYQTDPTLKWCMLFGISPGEGGMINGHLQLYFIDGDQHQYIEGFSPSFGEVAIEDLSYVNSLVFFISKKSSESNTFLNIMEIGKPKDGSAKFKKKTPIQYSPDVPNDIPILTQVSEKYQLLFIITKGGFLFIYDIPTASKLFRNRISTDLIFASVKNSETNGMICINRKGQIFSINIDENTFLPHIIKNCQDVPDSIAIALRQAEKNKMYGSEQIFGAQFNKLLAAGDYAGAAKIAYASPNNSLRTVDTINKLKAIPVQPGQPAPMLQYFSTMLEKGKLNAIESIELVKPVLAQNRKSLLENWIRDQKLEFSDELSELVSQYDPQLALSMNLRSSNHGKVLEGFVETGQLELILPYCNKAKFTPDFLIILQKVIVKNPEKAVDFAKMLVSREGGKSPLIPVQTIFELFFGAKKIQEATAFLLDALKNNLPEEGQLQTRLLEINLLAAPKVAEAIFQMKMFSHYDREKVAKLCERSGLILRALENYSDISDIRRVIVFTNVLKKEEIIEYLGKLDAEKALLCLQDLAANRLNLQIVIECSIKYSNVIPTNEILPIFEKNGLVDGVYYFLNNVIGTSQDPEVHFKYIEAATKLNNLREVERVIKESNFYDPAKVKNWLMEIKLQDPKPLIYLCDKHGFVPELTKYLMKNGFLKYIEIYLAKVNPANTGIVCSVLLDNECDETFIKNLLIKVRQCPMDTLIPEFEKRNKLKALITWLEARAEEGNQSVELHTALAKIYVDTGKDPQNFLINNSYYDPLIVGKYCESKDPHLAFTAYRKAWGKCDKELIELTNRNLLYKIQARYLVERQDADLWKTVLAEDTDHRKHLIEQVVQIALPESKSSEEVSAAVKAFLEADLQLQLIELLEKIVLHNSEFSHVPNLQTLLIMTAIKSDQTRVLDYINRLDSFNFEKIGEKLIEAGLFEAAYACYVKFDQPGKAIDVLIGNLNDLDKAALYAEKINEPEVWSKLGNAQLTNFKVPEAIISFIKAQDPSAYVVMIGAAERDSRYEELIPYLRMCKQTMKESLVDEELIFCCAKCKKYSDIEEFISNPNSADLMRVGDRCYEAKLYEAGKILFTHIGDNGKLASCLVNLGEFQAAITAATKANTPRCWKEVCFACVRAKEFKLATIAGLNVVIYPDHLEDLVEHYEKYGFWEELIKLLETASYLEQAHMGIFTELAILYAKYVPSKLFDHLRNNIQRLNIQKVIRSCEYYQMWPETVYLYSQYDEFDKAIITMIEHSPSCFQHELYVQNLQKVVNMDIYYKSIRFYLSEQPDLLNDLLIAVSAKIELTKAVAELKKTGYIALAEPFLKAVQSNNVPAVNEALNDVLLENDDYQGLRQSVTSYDNFDQMAFVKKVETHELIEFRRIAALLLRKNKRFEESISLSKKDEMYRDAIETALDSKSPDMVDKLLRYLAYIKERDSFAACLYTCYELVRPDIVLELAWRANYMEYAMPFFVQSVREVTDKIDLVGKKTEVLEKKEEKAEKSAEFNANVNSLEYSDMMMPGFNAFPMLMPPPEMMMPLALPSSQPMYFNQPGFGGFGGGNPVFPQFNQQP